MEDNINPRNLWRHHAREQLKAKVIEEVRKRAPISAMQMHNFTGYSKIVNTHELLREMVLAEQIYGARVLFNGKRAELVLFSTAEDRDEFAAKAKQTVAEREKKASAERNRRKLERLKAERAERVAERARARAEAKAAKEAAKAKKIAEREEAARLKAEAKANKTRSVVKTKRAPGNPRKRNDNAVAEMLRKQRRSDEAREKKVPVKIEPDFSRAKVTIAPKAPDRWAVEIPQGGGFSSMRPGQYALEANCCAARAAG